MVMIWIALVPFQILSIHSLCTEIVKYAHLCIYKSLQVHRRKKTENLKQKHGVWLQIKISENTIDTDF